MTPPRQKIKINNSYESEPSSGSGSSLSEPSDYHTFDDENMHLSYLLKPPAAFETVTTSFATIDPKSKADGSVVVHSYDASAPVILHNLPPNDGCEKTKDFRLLRHGVPLHSSQESSFEGFSDSPFGHMKRLLFARTYDRKTAIAPEPVQNPMVISKEQSEFLNFYESVVTENSCNAVDMQLDGVLNCAEKHCSPQCDDTAPQREKSSTTIDVVVEQKGNVPMDLTFNGKINRLTSQPCDGGTKSGTASQTLQSNAIYMLKKYTNERSPDLFDCDDDSDVGDSVSAVRDMASTVSDAEEKHRIEEMQNAQHNGTASSINSTVNCPTELSFADEQGTCENRSASEPLTAQSLLRNSCRREREMLRRVHKSLAGLPPPPSMTIPQLDMFEAVLSRKHDILEFLNFSAELCAPRSEIQSGINDDSGSSLMKPTHTLDEAKTMPWKDILGVQQHGLCYNLSKASERREYLTTTVIDRFVGSETASSYVNSPSSAKKRITRMKLLTQSPGNRLSHLAKRRAIFSSANLATTSQRAQNQLGPQILLGDKKKVRNRRKSTPKRMTPGSRKKVRNTPTSSARKPLFRSDANKPGPSRETSKRALFQSPAKQLAQRQAPLKPLFKPDIANRVEKSKRALFSPDNVATTSGAVATLSARTLDSLLKRKREPADDDDAESAAAEVHIGKQLRAEGFTPRALKIKSQSFCIGAGSSASSYTSTAFKAAPINSSAYTTLRPGVSGASSSQSLCVASNNMLPSGQHRMQRCHSDLLVANNTLTENQRKKLLWAVSQALQERKISVKHESFKQYASVLARVVRRIFQEYYQKGSTSNSETMLRLAKKHVYNVVAGKNADDIYVQAKAHIDDANRNSSTRLSGYIGPEDYRRLKAAQQQNQQQRPSQTLASQRGSLSSLFGQDSSVDYSFSALSQSSSSITYSATLPGAIGTSSSQATFLGCISQELAQKVPQSPFRQQLQQPIAANVVAQQRSSSKNNLVGAALRENIDCEQRRSAQKNFTGKDQRNVSPYASNAGSGLKMQTLLASIDGAKAKRQISFDS